MKLFTKSIIAAATGLTVFLITFSPISVGHYSTVPEAQAALTVKDVLNYPNNLKTSIESSISAVKDTITAVATLDLRIKEYILDRLAWLNSRIALQQVVADTAEYITSGLEGDPTFVTDLKKHLLQTGDTAAEKFISGDKWRVVCEPFQEDIEEALTINVRQNELNDVVPACTFDESQGDLQALLEGDFEKGGGWDAFFKVASQPQNTTYGAYIAAERELQDTILKDQHEQEKLLEFGDGFFSQTYCYSEDNCVITTPGEIFRNATEKTLGVSIDNLLDIHEYGEDVLGLFINAIGGEPFTGVNGLLGLGGGTGSNYSDLSSGFLDQMRNQQPDEALTGPTENPITPMIEGFKDIADRYNALLTRISNLKQTYQSYASQYPGCFDRNGSIKNKIDSWQYESKATQEMKLAESEAAFLKERFADGYDEAIEAGDLQRQESIYYFFKEYDLGNDLGPLAQTLYLLRDVATLEANFETDLAEVQDEMNQEVTKCQAPSV